MRSLYLTAAESGLTRGQLRWREQTGELTRVGRKVYRYGPEAASTLDRCLALVLETGAPASGRVAGVLHGLDSVLLEEPEVTRTTRSARRAGVRRRSLPAERVTMVSGFACVDATQTLVDLAGELSDDQWEQALESGLRERLVAVDDLMAAITPAPGGRPPAGSRRVRRVLARRPVGAAATGSVLETMALQLCRKVRGLGEPIRQYHVVNRDGRLVAIVDLCWPELGIFLELDGQQHDLQPLYDSRRQTAVVAATGWLVIRLTWDEVVRNPEATRRRLEEVAARAIAA